jgi:hypothetical protein
MGGGGGREGQRGGEYIRNRRSNKKTNKTGNKDKETERLN